MVEIKKLSVDNVECGLVTDNKNPIISYYLDSDESDVSVESAKVCIGEYVAQVGEANRVTYEGPELLPYSTYEVKLEVKLSNGVVLTKTTSFETAKLDTKWNGSWISDASYSFKEKGISPKIMVFRKKVNISKPLKSAKMYATALGIYDFLINKEKVGNILFAPGYTTYKAHLQYHVYDVKDLLKENNDLHFIISGGWAVGAFITQRVNRHSGDRQALLFDLELEYEDGSKEIISSDESCEVSMEGPVLEAEFYNGESYDANIDLDTIPYHNASKETLRINPQIICAYGSNVIPHELMNCEYVHTDSKGGLVYDFKQNFAGLVTIKLKNAKKGDKVVVRHAEILQKNGDLNVDFLGSAKQEINYICKDGEQEFTPSLTYMGFRYISVYGVNKEDVEVCAHAIYSDIERIGDFECSNEMINRLQQNIIWSSKSNFVDIPTDCPQRDERMGWTGDINVFAPTAVYNWNVDRLLSKWLKDMRAEQNKGGGYPNVIPSSGFNFPFTMPWKAVDFWGDAAIHVPYVMYKRTGNKKILVDMYDSMKRYHKACMWWASLLSVGQKKYIWSSISMWHFGDWVAPDIPKMQQWQARHKWTATASLCFTSRLLSEIATILGHDDDAKKYDEIAGKVASAYENVFTDGKGKLKEEFQTAYVLPLQFKMFKEENVQSAVDNLVKLVESRDYCIGTGFPGTPYILFTLADNGRPDVAYKMLLNTKCPSWLHEVKAGGTTIWERWDGLNDDGVCDIGDSGTARVMISYNHYASGAVGNFLYSRTLGLEPIEPGYKSFRVKPLLGGDITCAKGNTITPYGEIKVDWKLNGNKFDLNVKVPVGTCCEIILPNGESKSVNNGSHSVSVDL